MKLTLLRIMIAAGAMAGATASVPTSAHHSGAMFDFTKVVTLTGAVTQFQCTNPHVILWVEAAAAEIGADWKRGEYRGE